MQCSSCGTSLSPYDVHCRGCGVLVVPPDAREQAAALGVRWENDTPADAAAASPQAASDAVDLGRVAGIAAKMTAVTLGMAWDSVRSIRWSVHWR